MIIKVWDVFAAGSWDNCSSPFLFWSKRVALRKSIRATIIPITRVIVFVDMDFGAGI